MEFVRNVFWNDVEQRVRALWRLIGQLALTAAILLPLQVVVGFVAFGMLSSRSDISPEELSDPQLMQQFFAESPVVGMLSALAVAIAFTVGIALAGYFLDQRPFRDFGFRLGRDWWIDLGFGLLLGALLMTLIFLVELAAGWVTVTGAFVTRNPGTPFVVAILLPLITFVATGFYEELFSRGYQLRNIAEGLNMEAIGPRPAILCATLLSSAVFAVLHVFNPNANLISTLNIFFNGGVLLSLGYLLTGQLAIPIGIHITWNFFQGNVFGFRVSGADIRSASFLDIQQSGPDVWTGGAFGPEAGLVSLGAIILGALLIGLWVRQRYGLVRLEESIARVPETRPGSGDQEARV